MGDMLDRAADLLGVLNGRISSLLRTFCAGLLCIMTAVVLVQVVLRYLFNDSLSWSEELAKILMVWTAFLIAPWAYREGANVSIRMFVTALPRLLQSLLQILIHALVLWILLVLFQESIAFMQRGFSISAATLPVQMGWVYSVVPLGLVATFLVGVELLLKDLSILIKHGGPPEIDVPIVDV